jgi:lipopolysaccharide export system permease protein
MAWWPLHLLALLAALGLFAWRLNVNHRYHPLVLINAWKRRRHLRKAAKAGAPAAPKTERKAGAKAEETE